MKDELIKNIINKIEEYDTIAIYRHVFPDPDSYSSQTALKSIIENTYPNKKVVLLGEHSKNLEYINTMDEEIELNKDSLAIIVDVSNKERVDNQSFNNCAKTSSLGSTCAWLQSQGPSLRSFPQV